MIAAIYARKPPPAVMPKRMPIRPRLHPIQPHLSHRRAGPEKKTAREIEPSRAVSRTLGIL